MVKDHSESERGNPLLPPGLLFQLVARVLLYAPSHRQDSTYHGLWYTSRGALAETRNNSMREETFYHHIMGYIMSSEVSFICTIPLIE